LVTTKGKIQCRAFAEVRVTKEDGSDYRPISHCFKIGGIFPYVANFDVQTPVCDKVVPQQKFYVYNSGTICSNTCLPTQLPQEATSCIAEPKYYMYENPGIYNCKLGNL
jgi:hypothetical protein